MLSSFGATEADHRSGYASAMKRFQEHAAKLRASIAAGQCDTKSFGSMSVALGEAGGHSLSIEANDLLAEVQAVGKTAADLRLQLQKVCGSSALFSFLKWAVPATAVATGIAVVMGGPKPRSTAGLGRRR